MIKNQKEIAELRSTTHDLIEHNKWSLSFVRRAWERTSGGGQRQGAPTTLDSQDAYFGAVTIDAARTIFWEGEQVTANYVIVGYWPGHDQALDIAEKDEFTVDGRKFVVVEIHPDMQYETRAWVLDRTSNGEG